MPGYREISIPGEARPRPAVRQPAARPARGPAGGWRAALGGALAGTVSLWRRKPGAILGSVAAVGAAGFVCFNALGHQDGRHPAPILPKLQPAAAGPQRPAPAAEAAPARDGARPEARQAAAAPRPAARDPIGELIRADETTASVTPRPAARPAKPEVQAGAQAGARAPEKAAAGTPVLQAQRALAKLGFGPIKADGMMGASTRAAIESFERKAKLPVTGEAAGRTLRELVARGGQG